MAEPLNQPPIPDAAQRILVAYTEALNRVPGLVDGIFLHGSIVFGAFKPRLSDIDLITVVSRRCTSSDNAKLGAIHKAISAQFPRPYLEVSYLQHDDLGKLEADIEPHPFSHDGVLHPSGHHDENSVTWWLLQRRGIALVGEIPVFPVDWDALVTETHENLNSYWVRFTREPARITWLTSDFGIEWAVLGVLRQYYSFVENDITSKDGAGWYALDHLPARWRRIVQEALAIRQERYQSAYRFRLLRAFEAWRFLRYVIGVSNAHFDR